MRVISGASKGKVLKIPKGLHTRPTSDKVKEALFSMIHFHIPGSIVLDLFSGTGSLGIEALSRGAEKAYFVDNHPKSIQTIKENIHSTGYGSKSVVLFCDAQKAIQKLVSADEQIDIVFMDPPYHENLILPCIYTMIEKKLLKKTGLLIIEHDQKEKLPECIDILSKIKEKRYGNTRITIYAEEEKR